MGIWVHPYADTPLEVGVDFRKIGGMCWKVSARPSARLPLKSNLSVVPTARPKAFGRARSLQCNKTVLLLVLLVKLQSYDVWLAGKIIAQT